MLIQCTGDTYTTGRSARRLRREACPPPMSRAGHKNPSDAFHGGEAIFMTTELFQSGRAIPYRRSKPSQPAGDNEGKSPPFLCSLSTLLTQAYGCRSITLALSPCGQLGSRFFTLFDGSMHSARSVMGPCSTSPRTRPPQARFLYHLLAGETSIKHIIVSTAKGKASWPVAGARVAKGVASPSQPQMCLSSSSLPPLLSRRF